MRVLWLMALGVAALTSCVQPEALHKNEIIGHTLAVTVQVLVERADGVRRSGSGVVLTNEAQPGRTLILTAYHLVEPPAEQSIHVVLPRGDEQLEASLIGSDPEVDLALLETGALPAAPVTLDAEAQLGDDVWVVAFPWGGHRTVVKGVVSQVATTDPDHASITGPVNLIDASVSHGMSGGGVFTADTGSLIGLVRGYRTAQLALPGAGGEPLNLPVAAETTVISTADIICFLSASRFADLIPSVTSAPHRTGRPNSPTRARQQVWACPPTE